MSKLKFQETEITAITQNGIPYLTARQIGECLGYSDAKGGAVDLTAPLSKGKKAPLDKIAKDTVNNLYQRHADEFSEDMTQMIQIKDNLVRVFSPRGVWLLAMLSKAPKAKEFRKWVLDVLENHAGASKKQTIESDPEQMLDCKQSLKNLQQKLLPLLNDMSAHHHLTETRILLSQQASEESVSLENVDLSMRESMKNAVYHAIDELQDLITDKKPANTNQTIHHFLERASRHLNRK